MKFNLKMKNKAILFLLPRFLLLLLSIIITFTFNSCHDCPVCDCFKSSGNTISEQRNITGFNSIQVNDNIDLSITPGRDFKVKVAAGKNLIEKVTTELDGNTLILSNKNKCNWVRSFKNEYKVEVEMPSVDHVMTYSSGDIDFLDTVKIETFNFDVYGGAGVYNLLLHASDAHVNIHTGPGDVNAKGWIGVNYLYYNGYGKINFSDVETGYTFMENKGNNDIHIWVTKELEAKINYSGNIYYRGNPYKIILTGTGSGKLIKE